MDFRAHFNKGWTKKFGMIYTITITIIFAIINFYGQKDMIIGFGLLLFALAALYTPILLFLIYEKWNAKDFGIVLNRRMVIITLILLIPIIVILINKSEGINKTVNIISIITRVGEEVFYRGFLFQYLCMIFKNKKYPIIKTILLSSLFFTLVHTQTFLPMNNITMVDIFIYSVIFATIRYYTKSILTPVVLHCISDAGIFGGILGAVIYFILYKSRTTFNVEKSNV